MSSMRKSCIEKFPLKSEFERLETVNTGLLLFISFANIFQKMQTLANSVTTYTFITLVPAVQYNIRLVSRVGSGVMLVQSNGATISIATRKCFGSE